MERKHSVRDGKAERERPREVKSKPAKRRPWCGDGGQRRGRKSGREDKRELETDREQEGDHRGVGRA